MGTVIEESSPPLESGVRMCKSLRNRELVLAIFAHPHRWSAETLDRAQAHHEWFDRLSQADVVELLDKYESRPRF